jgi:membrane fusion protein (multidrug efflux system)
MGARPNRMRRWRWPLIIGGPLVILAVAAWFIVASRRYEATDNAYVQMAKTAVAPNIGGRVDEVYVRENQVVRRGQALFRLDPRDVLADAEAAEAEAAVAELEVRVRRATYREAEASAAAAREAMAHTAREAVRQEQLAAAGIASGQQVAEAAHAAQQARDQMTAARQRAMGALAALGGDPKIPVGVHPTVQQARARLRRAQLDVSYATVAAASDGVVTQVDQMPVGSYLKASQTGFWLLAGKPWIEANFKESQLTRMRTGQPVEIDVDAYPGVKLCGHVASFAPGTGSTFSVLPAQNATGNWVKVTQRLPVRIRFEKPPPELAGRAGLSATVTVDLRARNAARCAPRP